MVCVRECERVRVSSTTNRRPPKKPNKTSQINESIELVEPTGETRTTKYVLRTRLQLQMGLGTTRGQASGGVAAWYMKEAHTHLHHPPGVGPQKKQDTNARQIRVPPSQHQGTIAQAEPLRLGCVRQLGRPVRAQETYPIPGEALGQATPSQ
ncbi:hypothetical protein BS50DRAFT_137426 [Corynespora cassiicola Philippines]|uniref:Uncharacterized protein n=1 Tax=Corynespora cassiicola Philippines TaxID=1448308 RepID=A0A2T2NAN4_CORCC|nr:hypothetical protein BS50DRAFT_137426 [Corynespora cassiicola Philippines]